MLAAKHLIIHFIFYIGVTFFWFLIRCYHWIEYCPPYFCDPYKDVDKIYDYIVVGAGTSGSVLALRLAENKNNSVLVIEAGPTGGLILDVPTALPLLQLSSLDWGYKTVPQKNANLGLKDQKCNWPRGKVVGGTGRFNNMIYIRGHPLDFAEWYKNKSDYNYERDVLEIFKKSEHHLGSFRDDDQFHSTGGPLYVNDLPFVTDLSDAILDASKHLGIPVRDINGKHNTGFMKPQANLLNGARYSTGHYLLDNLSKNIHITTNTLAEKILFKENYEAYAVKTTKFGSTKTIKARKGVILTAGTIDTVKLLLLSGIGPTKHLKEIGIKPIVDLPVGENLQDHVTAGLDMVTLDSPLTLNPLSLISPYSIKSYIFEGKGPWTTIQCEATGIMHTACIGSKNFDQCSSKQLESPDLQIMILPMGFVSDNGAHLRDIIGISDNIWDNYIEPLIGRPTLSMLPILLHPKGRGTIKLADKNPSTKPLIDPKYLSHPDDVDVLIKGIELILDIIKSPSMQKLGAKLYEAKLPGCEQYNFKSRDYWECYIRHITITVYHPVGTAKMGHSDDPTSVVDYDFKVLGVNKLYVGDASVIPYIPSGNTNAATVLIAEKAAESIKRNDYLMSGRSYKSDIFTCLIKSTV